MRRQNHYFIAEVTEDALLEDLLSNLRVDRGKGVIKEVDIGSLVYGSSQVNASSLATAEGNSSFPHDGLVAVGEEGKIPEEGAYLDHLLVTHPIVTATEKDVLANRT